MSLNGAGEKLSWSPVSPTSLSLSHSKLNILLLVFNFVSYIEQSQMDEIFAISRGLIWLCLALECRQKYWIFHTKTWLAAPTIRTAPDLPSDNSTTLATTSIVEHRNTWPTTLTHLHLSKLQRSRKLNAMQWHLNCTFLVKYTLVQRVWEWECLKVCVRACVCVWQRLRESACVQKY